MEHPSIDLATLAEPVTIELRPGNVLMVCSDKGPHGMCAQAGSVVLSIFESEEQALAAMADGEASRSGKRERLDWLQLGIGGTANMSIVDKR